jgi:AraC-like DNA-binding protein
MARTERAQGRAGAARRGRADAIARVTFARSRGGSALDVEVKPAFIDRGRRSPPFLGTPERTDFFVVLLVTAGVLRHSVDFAAVRGRAGAVLFIHPGQVHQFALAGRWRGLLALFRPEAVGAPALAEVLEALPPLVTLAPAERRAVRETLRRMIRDEADPDAQAHLGPLLRAQLATVILRLGGASLRHQPAAPDATLVGWFRRFRAAVERHHAGLHEVADYARMLRCSERTLTRAARLCTGQSAKGVIAQRIVLEAKRLLVHTGLPAAAIAERLGFDEPTNFGKFFRRVAGCTPRAFRAQHA